MAKKKRGYVDPIAHGIGFELLKPNDSRFSNRREHEMKKPKNLGLKTSLKIAKKSMDKQIKRGDERVEVFVSWVRVSPKGNSKSTLLSKNSMLIGMVNKWMKLVSPVVEFHKKNCCLGDVTFGALERSKLFPKWLLVYLKHQWVGKVKDRVDSCRIGSLYLTDEGYGNFSIRMIPRFKMQEEVRKKIVWFAD